MNYYISDLHLFHKNVTKEGNDIDCRPFATLEEMHKCMVTNWNNVVTDNDDVYILGDLSWKENDAAIELISTLRGKKHLVRGNHDKATGKDYAQLFVEICDYKEIKDKIDNREYKIILSHYPIAMWDHQHHFNTNDNILDVQSIHLYGHVHASLDDFLYSKFIELLNKQGGIKCVARNVGCMKPYMDYTPRTLQEICADINNN